MSSIPPNNVSDEVYKAARQGGRELEKSFEKSGHYPENGLTLMYPGSVVYQSTGRTVPASQVSFSPVFYHLANGVAVSLTIPFEPPASSNAPVTAEGRTKNDLHDWEAAFEKWEQELLEKAKTLSTMQGESPGSGSGNDYNGGEGQIALPTSYKRRREGQASHV